ncbi:lysophospholipase L1-like esterase [Mucilaginibacter lappiensis]|uniref:Lysophospholipase L1-like esterase n=1 Tax=Mucilaginibacter lappiensis TaxID=354630 RepID=A0ABR6PTG0_9SPHI|nr:SGNH/GDSL hydrolase family protein [Mucilaginibacter lappiensis]MBB6113075.1 lysophospholipase L1-like esterase [Mucilaginibacter lappiensis]
MTHISPITVSPVPVIDTLSYLALGDSYTIGQSVDEHDAFPYQLAGQLPGHKITGPTIIARTGWTTQQLISAIDGSDSKDKTYDIVTLLIGVNDQYGGGSQADYRVKFVQVLNTAIKLAKGNTNHVFVLSIPDYGVTPFAHGDDARIGKEIDQFNDINRQESANASVNYIDITPISKLAANNSSLIANDGLHPSATMYQMWVEKLKPVVLSALEKK